MGREVRRVPKDWEHPTEWVNGRFKFKPIEGRDILNYYEEGDDLPEEDELMPEWKDSECTHYQMYETCTEGTPISPVCDSPETLARWLVDNGASAFGWRTASYEAWLRVCQGGYAPTAIISQGSGVTSGVEGLTEGKDHG